MRNLRQLFRRSGLLSTQKRRRRSENLRRGTATQRRLSNEVLEKRELLAGDMGEGFVSQHNYWNRYDVNDDFQVTARDALGIINYLASERAEAESVLSDSSMFYDVNADSRITAADALGVINAMSSGEGDADDLVELVLTARDLNDDPLPVVSGDVNVMVGQIFDLEVSYNDLRSGGFGSPDRLGAFQLFTDITLSQANVLSPVLNETQRLILDASVETVPFTSVTFSIPEAPPGISGGALTYEASRDDFFADGGVTEVRNAVLAFGYTASQFDLSEVDFDNTDIGYQIHWIGNEFGNLDLPNITFEVNETNPADDIRTDSREFAPFLADGVTPNTDAVRFNVNSFSRTFNQDAANPFGEQFYSSQNRGEFDPATGFTSLGGLGLVPGDGGGVPDLGTFPRRPIPFDAFSFRVFLNQSVTDLEIGVRPGTDPEATLLYGRDDAVPTDFVLFEQTAAADAETNGIANITINATSGANLPPAISVQAGDSTSGTITEIADLAPGENATLLTASGTLTFTDANSSDTHTVSATPNAGGYLGGFIPVITNDSTGNGSGQIRWTYSVQDADLDSLAEGQVLTQTYTIELADQAGGTDTQTATITINGTDDEPILEVDFGAGDTNTGSVMEIADGAPGENVDTLTASGTLSFTDVDLLDTHTVTAIPQASGFLGTLNTSISDAATGDGLGQVTFNFSVNDADLNFLDQDEVRTQDYTIRLTDNHGDFHTEQVQITITGAADALAEPVLLTIAATTNGNETGPVDGVFTVTLSQASSTDTTVNYTVGGTANAGDHSLVSGQVTILANSTSALITVPVIDDSLVEGDESVDVTLTSIAAGDPQVSLGATTMASINISDNDVAGTPQVTIAATTNGNETGPVDGVFTVTLSQASSTDTTVNYTVGGTANAGDHSLVSGQVTILANSTSALITVPVIDDSLVEGDESVDVTLTSIAAGDPQVSLGATTMASIDISDNDTAQVTIAATTNGNETGPVDGVFTVNLSQASSTNTVVNYTVGGTANAGDHSLVSGQVTILANSTSALITVPVIDDSLVEGDESVDVTLTSIAAGDPQVSLGATTMASIDISDNDTAQVTIAATTNGNETGPVNGVFTVNLSQASSTDTVVNYTVGGSADAGDHSLVSGQVTILANSTSALITVPVINDTIDENNENVSVTLTSIAAGDPQVSLGATTMASIDIFDNDGPGNAIIGGSVFIDEIVNIMDWLNGADPIRDGIKQADENALGGVEINLSGNGLSLKTITDIDGHYSFEGLVVGSYDVMIDADETSMILAGVSEMTVTVGSNSATIHDVNFPLINVKGDTVDILASSYRRNGDDVREGGVVALDPSGDQKFFVAFEGYEGVSFLELNLNAERDAALLTIVEEGGHILSTRLVVDEDFHVSESGAAVQFFGGRNDHEFFDVVAGSLDEFHNHRNAIDEFFGLE